jgi:adenylosuccinate lyase
MCRTFWEMMRSEVGELEEPRKPRQRGSSYMPHKKNPILDEQFMGIPRLMRNYMHAAFENIETPEARDISQSIVERHIFPDATYLLYYQAGRAAALVQDLVVFPDAMKQNLERTLGVWASPQVREALMDAGVPYDLSYDYMQKASFKVRESKMHLLDVLRVLRLSKDDSRTAETILGKQKLSSCFDAMAHIREGIEHIFRDE